MYFKDSQEAEQVIGGFLRTFPRLTPIFAEVTGKTPLTLKLELSSPELKAEIDLSVSPLAVRIGSEAWGAVGMSGPADNFHLLLLGQLPPAVAINQKRLVVRGSVAKIMKTAPLIYLAPYIYPFYLESIGREDLILAGEYPPYHALRKVEENMNRVMIRLAYVAGYLMGLIKRRLSPGLDVLASLEAMGEGLRKASQVKK